MPVLMVKTNVSADEVSDDFISEASALVAKILGKPESYVCVDVSAGQKMSFGGSTTPCAYCELHSIGGLGGKKNNEHAKVLFPLIQKFLGIQGDRMYLKFVDVNAAEIAYNGHTFA